MWGRHCSPDEPALPCLVLRTFKKSSNAKMVLLACKLTRPEQQADQLKRLKGFTLNHVQVGDLRAVPTASQDVGGACCVR